MGMGQYILDGHSPVECNDLTQWGQWMQNADRRVAKDELPNGVMVSTVFLGLDHSFGGGIPLLFETMVFNGSLDQEQQRYNTWDEAMAGHLAMVNRVLEAQT